MIERYTPLGMAHGLLYLILVLFAARSESLLFLVTITFVSILAIASGTFISIQGVSDVSGNIIIFNRLMSIVAILVCFAISRHFILSRVALEQRQKHLADVTHLAEIGTLAFSPDDAEVQVSVTTSELLNIPHQQLTFSEFTDLFNNFSISDLKSNLAEISDGQSDKRVNALQRSYQQSEEDWFKLHLFREDKRLIGLIQPLQSHKELLENITSERKKFQQFANKLPVYLVTVTTDGHISFASDSILDFFGVSLEFLDEQWLDVVHPEDKPLTLDRWEQLMTQREVDPFYYRVKDKCGKIHHWVSSPKALVTDNKVREWVVVSHDETDLVTTKQRFQAFAEKFEHILETTHDGFFIIDHSNAIATINQQAINLLQLHEDCAYHQHYEAGDFFNQPKTIEHISALLTKERTQTKFEARINNKDLAIRCFVNELGVTGTVMDITEEKRFQHRLQLLHTAINQSNDVFLITKADNVDLPGPEIIYVNDGFERITGYKKSEAIGRSPRFLQGEDTEQENLAIIKEALISKQPVRAQLTNYKKDGTPYINEVSISPVLDDEGNATHFISVQRDITQEKEIEKRDIRAHKLDSIGMVSGCIAHDFNNLLTVIVGNTELLLINTPEDDKSRKPLSLIFEAAEQGVKLTSSLLTYAKRQPADMELISLNEFLQHLKPLIASAITEEFGFTINVDTQCQYLCANSSKLETIFMNMAINAKDAMVPGQSFHINISEIDTRDNSRLTDLPSGTYIKIDFEDNGCGMDEDTLEHIFEPFFTTKNAKNKGTGLGLSQVYNYMKESGGMVDVYSEPGVGTCFSLYFPEPEENSVISAKSQNRIIDTSEEDIAVSDKPLLVLVIEDNKMVAHVAKYLLDELNYDTLFAASGPEAVALIDETDHLDLMFTDIVLPDGYNGKMLADKAREKFPDLPVLFTSGYTSGKLEAKDLEHDNVSFLQKPYKKQELKDKLRFLARKAKV